MNHNLSLAPELPSSIGMHGLSLWTGESTLHLLSLGYSNSSILEISDLCLLLSELNQQTWEGEPLPHQVE
jgi:hypothetical protein